MKIEGREREELPKEEDQAARRGEEEKSFHAIEVFRSGAMQMNEKTRNALAL